VYREELTYQDVLPSGEVATTELHPTYIGLLIVFRAFLLAKLQIVYAEEHLHPYDVLSGMTREDFIVFLHGYKEYSDISFPVVGVLPGNVLEKRHPSATTKPTVPTGDTSPTASIDQPSPKSTNGPSASTLVPPFPLEEVLGDDPVPSGSIINLKEEYPYDESTDTHILSTARFPMQDSDALLE